MGTKHETTLAKLVLIACFSGHSQLYAPTRRLQHQAAHSLIAAVLYYGLTVLQRSWKSCDAGCLQARGVRLRYVAAPTGLLITCIVAQQISQGEIGAVLPLCDFNFPEVLQHALYSYESSSQ